MNTEVLAIQFKNANIMFFIFSLILRGQKLEPGRDLAQYGIENGTIIFLVKKSKNEIEAMVKNKLEKFRQESNQCLALQTQYLKHFSGML